MDIVKLFSSLPGWVQVSFYLIAILASLAFSIFITTFVFGLILFVFSKTKQLLKSVALFGLGLAGKIGNPMVERIYEMTLMFRNNIVSNHRNRLLKIRADQNINTSEILQPQISSDGYEITQSNELIPLWEKFPACIRTDDGHLVRSNPEKMIDDWLSKQVIFHYYEKRLPFPGIHYCDFFLPQAEVYIEYWGLDSDDYLVRKQEKLKLYSEFDMNLISIEENDLRDIDHFLQEKLRRFGYLPQT